MKPTGTRTDKPLHHISQFRRVQIKAAVLWDAICALHQRRCQPLLGLVAYEGVFATSLAKCIVSYKPPTPNQKVTIVCMCDYPILSA